MANSLPTAAASELQPTLDGTGAQPLGAASTPVHAAPPVDASPPRPRPLRPHHRLDLPYPVDVIGGRVGDAIRAVADHTGVPDAVAAQIVIASLAAAHQGGVDVLLPDHRSCPISLILATVSQPGDAQSEAHDHALEPLVRLGREQPSATPAGTAAARPSGAPVVLRSAVSRARLEKMADAGHTSIGLCVATDVIPPSKPGVTYARDGLWAGGVIDRVWREGRVTTISSGGRAVDRDVRWTIHLAPSLTTAVSWLSDPQAQAVLLACMPPESTDVVLWDEPSLELTAALARYHADLAAALRRAQSAGPGSPRRILALSAGATAEHRRFYDEVALERAPGGRYEAIPALAARMHEHAVRLAAVLALGEAPEVTEIDAEHMRAAAEIVRYHATITLGLQGDLKIIRAQLVEEWLLKKRRTVTAVQDVHQSGPNHIKQIKASGIRELMHVLEAHGRLIPIHGGASVQGKYRREAWTVVREEPMPA
jgi:hypothetical protein